MKKLLSEELAARLFADCGPFAGKLEGEAAAEHRLRRVEDPLSAKLEPLPFRRFLKEGLQEGAFVFAWEDEEALRVLALMEDSDPFSEAGPSQDRTWLKGDVMELFLQPPGGKLYYELHIAPNGATLELAIPSVESFRADPIGGFESRLSASDMAAERLLFDGKPFKGWAGLISVPLRGKLLQGASAKGFRFCVGRYNYNRAWGEKPEISSHVKFNKLFKSFHSPELWPSFV